MTETSCLNRMRIIGIHVSSEKFEVGHPKEQPIKVKAGKDKPPNLQRMDSVMAALGLHYFSIAANLKQRFVIGKWRTLGPQTFIPGLHWR